MDPCSLGVPFFPFPVRSGGSGKIEKKKIAYCVLCNVRRFNLFCTIISGSGHKQGKG